VGRRVSIVKEKRHAWMPVAFAHGFPLTSDVAETDCRATDFYAGENERAPSWNDHAVSLRWSQLEEPTPVATDFAGTPLSRREGIV